MRDVFKSKATEDELLKVFVEINQKGSAPLALVTATMACSCQALRAECDGDLLKAWRHAARASYFCGLYISQQSGGDFFLGNGKKGAETRWAKDPKTKAKAEAKEYWLNNKYDTKADFARAIMDKYPNELKSQVKLARWAGEWDKERAGLPACSEDGG